MFPAKFDYCAPSTLDEALDLLANRDDEARVLAGGQSLIPLLKLRFAAPEQLIDLGRIHELRSIERHADALDIGALARHVELEQPERVPELPLLARTAAQIADPLVRNLGTLGGSLAHADPRGDWAASALALRAQLGLRSRSGSRWVPAHEFFLGTFATALAPGEILERVRIARPAGRASGHYLKLERKVGDFATVGVAVQLELDAGEAIGRAGIGLAAVGPGPLCAERAEQFLIGATPSAECFAEAARLAAEDAQPEDDTRGSARYKRHVVEVFVRRGLERSLADIQSAGDAA